MTLILQNEPEFIAPGFGDSTANKAAANLRLALGQRLATYDHRGDLHAMLAAELPSSERGTWVVRPDGSMQTRYVLRPGITWHDGAPFTSRDVLFGWMLTSDRDLGQGPSVVSRQIALVEVVDDLTFTIDWLQTYPNANALVGDELGPLPAHLLENTYQTDKERLLQRPYFSQEFIGLGPYYLAGWERGSHLTMQAYDQFYLGRARIDTIFVRFVPSPTTAVANLLAGAADGALPRALDFNQAMVVKAEWERAGKQPVVLPALTHWRMISVQFRPDVANPREILDARVRRALLHAIDRASLAEALVAGQSPVSDTFIPPDDAKWEWVKDVAVHYEYDQRRAIEALAQVGWPRGGDGAIVNATGARVVIPLWAAASAQNEQEQLIVADNWRAVGLGVDQMVLTQAQDSDRRFRSLSPGFDHSGMPLNFANLLGRVHGNACPSEADRWAGSNKGCWQDPAADRVNDALQIAITPGEQRSLYREMMQTFTTELPLLPLYYSVQVVVFREGVTGVKGDTRPSGSETWNIAEWDIS